jgi:rare lipoprotein A
MAGAAVGRARIAASVGLLGLLLAGCASRSYVGSSGVPGDGDGRYRVGEPYEINGVWYYPAVDYDYDKTGVASWYGWEFAGRYTANGEIFDPNRLTAANTTLPMPSIVEVTNLQNGRSLRLRVNDRGPFRDGRLIDVSRRAAQLLGFETRGTTPVEVRVLKEESIAAAEQAMGYRGQVVIADAAINAATGPLSEEYSTVPPPTPPVLASAPRPLARYSPPRPTSAVPLRAPQPAIAPRAVIMPTARGPAPPPRSYAAMSRLSLIASAEAAPLPRPAVRPAKPRAAATRVAEMPRSRPSLTPAEGGSSVRLYVQAGAFSVQANARRIEARIALFGSVRVTPAAIHGVKLYRVQVGPVASSAQAHRLLRRVVASGCPDARIVTD